MNYINSIIKFFESSFVSTMAGVIAGGILTLIIGKLSERASLRLSLKLQLWTNVSEFLNEIDDITLDIGCDLKVERDALEDIKDQVFLKADKIADLLIKADKIADLLIKVDRKLKNYFYIFLDFEEPTKECDEKIRNFINSIRKGSIEDIDNNLTAFEDALMMLTMRLQRKLLNDLFNRRRELKVCKAEAKKCGISWKSI